MILFISEFNFFFCKRRAFAYFYHCKYNFKLEEILCVGNHVAVKQKINKKETLKIKFLNT